MTSGTTIRGSVVFLDTSDGGRASSVDSRECCLSWSFPISVSCSSISATDQQIGHLLLVIQREYFIRHPPNLVNLRIGHWSIVHFNTLCLLLGLRSCYDRIAIPIGWLPFFVIPTYRVLPIHGDLPEALVPSLFVFTTPFLSSSTSAEG